jgi:hypothetical protein
MKEEGMSQYDGSVSQQEKDLSGVEEINVEQTRIQK